MASTGVSAWKRSLVDQMCSNVGQQRSVRPIETDHVLEGDVTQGGKEVMLLMMMTVVVQQRQPTSMVAVFASPIDAI